MAFIIGKMKQKNKIHVRLYTPSFGGSSTVQVTFQDFKIKNYECGQYDLANGFYTKELESKYAEGDYDFYMTQHQFEKFLQLSKLKFKY